MRYKKIQCKIKLKIKILISDHYFYDPEVNMELMDKTILVIEDDEIICRLLSYILQKAGYTVLVCKTAKEAFKWLKENHPSAVLCDIALPDISGDKILTLIRKIDYGSKLPVVAVTSSAQPGDKERILGCGFDGYIAKPFKTTTFVSEVEEYIKKYKVYEAQ
jgi:CheY-like chemotaxis protein